MKLGIWVGFVKTSEFQGGRVETPKYPLPNPSVRQSHDSYRSVFVEQ
jgi:hypothetical protein